MGVPDHFTCLLGICVQVKKQQLEPGMEQYTGSKLEGNTSRLHIVILLI